MTKTINKPKTLRFATHPVKNNGTFATVNLNAFKDENNITPENSIHRDLGVVDGLYIHEYEMRT